jgi:hypothetical protein
MVLQIKHCIVKHSAGILGGEQKSQTDSNFWQKYKESRGVRKL